MKDEEEKGKEGESMPAILECSSNSSNNSRMRRKPRRGRKRDRRGEGEGRRNYGSDNEVK